MLPLYEYPQAIDDILAEAEEHGGELSLELVAELDSLTADLHAKVRQVQGAIRHYQALEVGAGAESARLRSVQKIYQNRVDSLKYYLLICMRAECVDRVVTEIGGVSRCKNSQPIIRWTDVSRDPPDEFMRKVFSTKIDQDAVLEAWRDGRLPDGFSVEQNEHLRIK